jgi:PAS domain S-box-containing protein
MEIASLNGSFEWLAGSGDMVDAVRAKDWGATVLGPVSGWAPSIRTAVSICLSSHFQMAVLSGPELVYIYNDATVPIFGAKHPWALGQRVADVWPEAWPTIGPMLTSVLATGQAVRRDDLLLVLERGGFAEECYFTFSYSPIGSRGGSADGVFVTTMETTARVLRERRQRTLSELATEVALRRGDEYTLERVREALARNRYDLPLAALYLAAPGGQFGDLVFCTGLGDGAGPLAQRIEFGPAAAHPAARAALTLAPQVFGAECLLGPANGCGIWPEQPRQMLALPFALPGQTALRGVLVVGANPRSALEAEYRLFLDALLGHLATAIGNIEAIDAARIQGIAHQQLERRVELRTVELREANQLLSAVFDRAPSGIALTDTRGIFVRANAAYRTLLGFGEGELAGRNAAGLVEPEQRAQAADQLRRLLAGAADSFELEMRCRLPDGSLIWVHNFVSLIADHAGKPRYFVTIAQDITARKRVEAERLASQQEMRVLYERLQKVRETERTALAREVHDQLGQILSAAKIDIKLLEDDLQAGGAGLSPAAIITELRSASGTLDRAVRVVRRIATELRAPELDDQGLYAAIEWHARDFERRTRILTEVEIAAGLTQPAPDAAAALLRIFQEAMTNVLRHAQAGQVWISLDRRAGLLLLRVRDDGAGIARQRRQTTHSLGITGMYERAALAGGRLAVGPLTPRGTLVSARIPFDGAGGRA